MRTLAVTNPYEQGADVEDLQRLLGVTPADGIYGVQTANAVYRTKVRLGYAKPDHVAGDLLVAYLTGKKKPTAAMVKRAHDVPKTDTPGSPSKPPASRDEQVRGSVVDIWHLLIANASRVHYPLHDVRTTSTIHLISTRAELLEVLNSPRGLSADCSQTASMVAHIAGAKCPDGDYAKDWAADGYTGTMVDGSEHITRSQVRVGDFRVYGAGSGHHVTQVVQVLPRDLLTGSHGSDPPRFILDSDEAAYQAGAGHPGGTWLRLAI